jgi:hypothetical protein
MPPDDFSSYPSDLRPLSFPTAQASAAKVVLDRIAAVLEQDLTARPGLVQTAQDGWEGAYRQEFDETWSTQSVRLAGLKEDLRRLSGQLTTAMETAASINEGRATQRATYDAERSVPAAAD